MNEAGASIFDTGLPRTRANHRPLTPLDFLAWSASVFPERTGVVYGEQALQLGRGRPALPPAGQRACAAWASAAATRWRCCAPTPRRCWRRITASRWPGAVLNALNTRLDPASIAFILEHGEAKVLLADTEWAPVVKAALAQMQRRPTVIDIVDPAAPGERLGEHRLRGAAGRGRPGLRLGAARPTSGTRSRSATPRAPPATPRAWSTTIAAPS